MIRLAFILVLVSAVAASAQLLLGVTTNQTGGGVPIPPSCSNSLVFSDACNSQYLGGI